MPPPVPMAKVTAATPPDISSVRASDAWKDSRNEVRPDVVGGIERQQQYRGDGQHDDEEDESDDRGPGGRGAKPPTRTAQRTM